jgi:hypothetical protein
VSSGQPLVGRCAEYPLDPLRSLKAQRDSIPGRNGGSAGCCQWQGVRAHAAPGHEPWRIPPSHLHPPHATRLGVGG